MVLRFVRTTGTADEAVRILRSFGVILEVLNQLRNRGSIAHPNSQLLDEPEAMLAINAARTILHYLDSRFIS